MKYIEERFSEKKTNWSDGPWQDEPDKVQWQDPTTQLPCLIVRNNFGAWCGYVGVSKGHPLFEQHYDKGNIDVHGGLTYSDHCVGKICHVVEEGEDDNVWWLGFDCSHAGDLAPGLTAFTHFPGDVYRNEKYVKREVTSLAQQLHNYKGPNAEC